MHSCNRLIGVCLTLTAIFAIAAPLHASSAWFQLRCEQADLGKPSEPADDSPPQYHIKIKQGESLTLAALAIAAPRGAAQSPIEADAGAWLFDDSFFTLQAVDRAKYDKTMTALQLQPTKPGKSRIRFVGLVLGYERKYDVLVEVVAADVDNPSQ